MIGPIDSGADLRFVKLSGQPDDGPQPTGVSWALSTRANAVIILQQTAMIRRLEEMNYNLINEIARLQSNFIQKLNNTNKSMQRLMIQPATRPAITNEEIVNDRMR